jgi:hypothetical protein
MNKCLALMFVMVGLAVPALSVATTRIVAEAGLVPAEVYPLIKDAKNEATPAMFEAIHESPEGRRALEEMLHARPARTVQEMLTGAAMVDSIRNDAVPDYNDEPKAAFAMLQQSAWFTLLVRGEAAKVLSPADAQNPALDLSVLNALLKSPASDIEGHLQDDPRPLVHRLLKEAGYPLVEG